MKIMHTIVIKLTIYFSIKTLYLVNNIVYTYIINNALAVNNVYVCNFEYVSK